MPSIKLLNGISQGILTLLPNHYRITEDLEEAQGLILRSADLHEMVFPQDLLCIARAGAGVNNIPLNTCAEKGIVVFNTPGANANAVKELVIAGLLISSRNLIIATSWTSKLRGVDIEEQVERGKKAFIGPELKGKMLGVIGLGAIGTEVANAAEALGLQVLGFDPYLSVDAAWGLSPRVSKAESLDTLLAQADFVTLHIPFSAETKQIIDAANLAKMKQGARLLNFSRAGLVDDEAMAVALDSGKLSSYVTDFPNSRTLQMEKAINIPHLGASTPESENECLVMAANQVREFLEKGNIRNSANFPACELPQPTKNRLSLIHKNVPNMLGQISHLIAEAGINILHLANNSRQNIAYTLIELEEPLRTETITTLQQIEGMIRTRQIVNEG